MLGYRQEIEALTKVYRKLLESHTLNGPVPAATTQLPSMQANTVKGEVSYNADFSGRDLKVRRDRYVPK